MYVCVCVCIYVCMYVCVCMYVRMYVCMCAVYVYEYELYISVRMCVVLHSQTVNKFVSIQF